MSEKTLKFDNIGDNKKEFHKSKQPNNLDLVNVDQIVISDKYKHSDDGFKYLLVTKKVRSLNHYVLSYLPQMSGYIKYFEKGGKNVFLIKDDNVLDKYNEIWNKIKKTLNIEFHSMPVYDEKYIKAKVREFNGVIKTNFLGDEIPKESMYYTCIACITIDSVMRMEKKNYPQVYLEECKYKIKKIKMPEFIDIKVESASSSDSE